MTLHAVLTGDLIGSRALTPAQLEFARAEVSYAVEALGRFDGVFGRPEFFRGDGWQLALSPPKWALRTALAIRARLRGRIPDAAVAPELAPAPRSRGLDTRISIGVGRVDRLHPERISLSTGEAFLDSGLGLDDMTNQKRTIGIRIRNNSEGNLNLCGRWINRCVGFLDDISRGWSISQSESVFLKLVHPELAQDAIARMVSGAPTRQAVAKSLSRAKWSLVEETLLAFEHEPFDGA